VTGTHMIVLPGGGYAAYSENEAEPIAGWLRGLGIEATVFPLPAQRPSPGARRQLV